MKKIIVVCAAMVTSALGAAQNARAAGPLDGTCNSSSTCVNASQTSTGSGWALLANCENGGDCISATNSGATSASYGIYGGSQSGDGVHGTATYGNGVSGQALSGNGVEGIALHAGGNGVAGLYGSVSIDSTYSSSGVYGASDSNAGTVGVTSAPGGPGIYGNCSGSGCYGVYGDTIGTGSSFAVYSHGNLQVTGTPYCSGCTAFTSNSDIRLKNNVQPIAGALDRLLQLRGVTFEWKDPAEQGNHTGTQRGFIAQEVEKVVPEWVGIDGKGFKTLNLTGMEPMIVESLRTLKVENDELRGRVKALEASGRPLTSGLAEGGLSAFLGMLLALGTFEVFRRRSVAQAKS